AHRERYRAFDLRRGPLWQACLVRLSDVEHVLTTSFSHVIADGWSGRLFAEEVLRAYRARMSQGPPLPRLDVGLPDLIKLQFAALVPTPDRAAYWQRQLSPPVRYLPFEPMTPAADADLILEAGHRFSFPADTHRMLRQVAWRAKTTPYLVLMAAYHILISL